MVGMVYYILYDFYHNSPLLTFLAYGMVCHIEDEYISGVMIVNVAPL